MAPVSALISKAAVLAAVVLYLLQRLYPQSFRRKPTTLDFIDCGTPSQLPEKIATVGCKNLWIPSTHKRAERWPASCRLTNQARKDPLFSIAKLFRVTPKSSLRSATTWSPLLRLRFSCWRTTRSKILAYFRTRWFYGTTRDEQHPTTVHTSWNSFSGPVIPPRAASISEQTLPPLVTPSVIFPGAPLSHSSLTIDSLISIYSRPSITTVRAILHTL